jgi:AraC-like DNA-binding protein
MKGSIGSIELLKEALLSMQARLARDGKVRFVVAKPTLVEFKRQKLPEHIEIGLTEFVGTRLLKRSSHHANVQRVVHAQWPDDHLVENTVPALSCIVRGAAEMRIADYILYCKPGDYLLHPPFVPSADGSLPHFEGDTTNRECDILIFGPGSLLGQGIECSMCHSIGDQHVGGTYIWIKNLLIAQLFQSIYEESSRQDNTQSLYLLVNTLLFFVQREIEEKRVTPSPFKSLHEYHVDAGSDPIKQARNYMETHLSNNLTTREIARLVCMSPSVFSQRFRGETGQTFHQYLTTLRLKQTAILLEETEYKINEISKLVGLTDSQLRSLTKQHWGCTPKEYRNQHKSTA